MGTRPWCDVSGGVASIIMLRPGTGFSLSPPASEMSLPIPSVGLGGVKPEPGHILVPGL